MRFENFSSSRFDLSSHSDLLFYVALCSFVGMHSTNYGGCIYSSKYADIHILNCLFVMCKSTQNGGCCYITGANFTNFRSICASDCYSSSIGMFGMINAAFEINMELVSVLRCCPNMEGQFQPIYLLGNRFRNHNMNSSLNKPSGDAGFLRCDTSSIDISQVTVDRTSSIIVLFISGSSGYVRYLNIIHNIEHTRSGYAIVYCDKVSNWDLLDTVFFGNDYQIAFRIISTLSIHRCFFDDIKGSTQSLSMNNIQIIKTLTKFEFHHVYTALCKPEFIYEASQVIKKQSWSLVLFGMNFVPFFE